MSFSKGWEGGVNPDGKEWDGYRAEHEVKECSYPNCKHKKISREEHAVCWNGVHIPNDEFDDNLSPLGKLAVVANPRLDFNNREATHYYMTMFLHAECAAEWGMHLIKDALGDYSIGNKLRETRKNAIRKQA